MIYGWEQLESSTVSFQLSGRSFIVGNRVELDGIENSSKVKNGMRGIIVSIVKPSPLSNSELALVRLEDKQLLKFRMEFLRLTAEVYVTVFLRKVIRGELACELKVFEF